MASGYQVLPYLPRSTQYRRWVAQVELSPYMGVPRGNLMT